MKSLLFVVSCLILHARAQLEYGAEESPNTVEADNFIENESLAKILDKRVFCSNPCTCGIANQVMTGATTTLNRLPYALRMWVQTDAIRKLFCGAALINSRYALTTASCFKNIDVTKVTVSIVRFTDPLVKGFNRNITYEAHPLYNSTTLFADLAIVKFNTSITLGSNNISPICLPPDNSVFSGKKGYTAIWGRLANGAVSKNPRSNIAPILSNADCKKITNRENLLDSMVCAGPYLPGATSVCQSDHGGPLSNIRAEVVNGVLVNRHKLVGLASYGFGCFSESTAPGVYTRVGNFLSYIYKKTTDGCYCSS